MLKLINLKRLTTKTLIGILVASSFITQSGNKIAVAGQCDNNGHGNNGDIILSLPSGTEVLMTKFDPSNPGNGSKIEKELRDSNPGITNDEVAEAKQMIQNGNFDFERRPSSGQDSDCDGIDDLTEVGTSFGNPVDTDNDTTPDFLDIDSDNDGKLDKDENNVDENSDGVVDRLQPTSITVSIEAPGIQTSQLPSTSNYYVVDFNDQSIGTAGFSKTNGGTTYSYGSDLDIQNANQWGGAEGSKFITQELKETIRSYNIKVDQDQKYFGFWWSAGDPYNQITFKNNGNEVAVFKTEDLVDFIQSSGVNDTQAYYGNPAYSGSGGHENEPFSFVNVFFNDQEYDEIVVATLTEGGSAFESDNHTFSASKQTIRGIVISGITSDSDYDGLIDAVDPDPNNADMDDDGLLDGNDQYPQDSDHDDDGLIDGQDPDPNDSDFDDDGLLDGEDPNPEDANTDSDNDGLSDAEEMKPSTGNPATDPNNPDTDGDGLNDGDEVNTHQSDPTKVDTDGDTINDNVEVTNGTDPNKVDTDGDGLNDNVPEDPDPTEYDTDNDGINDGNEENGDYDGDGEPDYELKPGGTPNDIDGDGIDNNEDKDSDGDRVKDKQEMNKGSNPYRFDHYAD